jgi:hypothetical protein
MSYAGTGRKKYTEHGSSFPTRNFPYWNQSISNIFHQWNNQPISTYSTENDKELNGKLSELTMEPFLWIRKNIEHVWVKLSLSPPN